MATLSALGLAVAPVEAANVPVALGWGLDDHGQLGQGTQVVFPTPTPIDQTGALAGKTVVKTVSGGRHVLALTADGKVYAWGDNSSRQLGNNSNLPSSSPVEVMAVGELIGKTVIDIAATSGTSLLVTADFQLWGWGSGALGLAGANVTGLPIRINSGALLGKAVVQIAAGSSHVAALTSDGVVATFSTSNSNGQQGTNNTTSSTVPVAIVDAGGVLAGQTVVAVAARQSSTFARTSNGQLFAWGNNSSGQLGVGDKVQKLAPALVSGSLVGKVVTSMAIGNSTSYAIAADNTLHSWGSNGLGALGTGLTTPTESLVPTAADMLPFAGKTLDRVTAGSLCAAVRTTTGEVFTWGQNGSGQLGGDFPTSRSSASQVSFTALGTGLSAVDIHADGVNYMSACLSDGRLVVWGHATFGRAGNGLPFLRGSPTPIPISALPLGQIWTLITAGQNHTLGISTDGKVYAWGSNSNGQLGRGTFGSAFPTPQAVQSSLMAFNDSIFTAIAAGMNHSVALNQDSQVFAWGLNSNGQLGNGSSTTQPSAVAVATAGTPLAGKTVAKIAAGNNHTLALTTDGVLVAWGSNSEGQMGDNSTTNRNLPIAVSTSGALSGKTVVGIAAGALSSYALTADGLIYAWGANVNGQLGDETTARSTVPVAVSTNGFMAGKFITYIAASENNAYAVASDGTLFGWGSNSSGQLADGNQGITAISEPIILALPAGHTHRVPASVNGTFRHVNVVTTDGAVFSSGSGGFGALALGETSFGNQTTLTHLPGTGKDNGLKVLATSSNGQGQHVVATAEYTTPELEVQHPVGTALSAGSAAISFGSTAPSTTVQRTIRLTNLGEANLNNLEISISTPEVGSFSVVGNVPSSLAEDQDVTLIVQYSASTLGSYAATLQVTSNDPVNPVFNIALSGEVITPVSLQSQPVSQMVSPGTPVTLSVVAVGSPTITYQWFKNDLEIEGAQSATLDLGQVSLLDQGNYYVVVTNAVGSVTSNPVTLTVASGTPQILTQPQSVLVAQGSPVTLQVAAIGQPPLSYQWQYKGRNIRGATGTTFILPAASFKQAGEYRVVVSSQLSVISNPVNVGVVGFVGGSLTVPAGGKTQLQVAAAGGLLSFAWRKDDAPLPNDSRITGGDTATLSLRALDPGTDANPNVHSGDYTCRVSMSGAPTLETPALSLKVFDSQPRLLTPVNLPPAAIGLDYSTFIPVESNPQRAPQRFTASGLPRGLRLNPITGEIAGRPLASKPGGFNIKIAAVNSRGKATTETTLNVRALPSSATGTFAAVIAPEAELNGNLGGQLDLKIQPTGAVSGSVRLGTQRLRFKGLLNASLATESTTATLSIPRKGRAALLLSFTIDDTADSDPLTGQIEDPEALGDGSAAIQGWNNPWTKALKADLFVGTHNLALSPPEAEIDNLLLPQGIGFGSFKVGGNGKLRVRGKLADGQGFAVPAFVGADGQIAMFQLLYPGRVKGSISGRIDIASGTPQPSPAGNGLAGGLSWNRPPDLSGRSRLYPAGFSLLELEVAGGGYLPPVGEDLLLGRSPANAAAGLSFEAAAAADLPTSPNITVSLLPRGGVRLPLINLTNTTLKTRSKTGALSGGFTVNDGGVRRVVKFQGQVVPFSTGSIGVGYFLLPELGAASPLIRSGTVTLGDP